MPDQAGSLIKQVGATKPCKVKECALRSSCWSHQYRALQARATPTSLLNAPLHSLDCPKAFHAICLPPGVKPRGRQTMAGTALAI